MVSLVRYELLTLDEEAFKTMQHLAVDMLNIEQKSDAEMLEKKTLAIAKCRRKLDALRNLYEDGDLVREEYLRRKQNIEHELAQWENYTTETETIGQQLLMCVDAVTKIAELWQNSTDEGRRGLAHNLFEEIVYDLDKQQIVDFRLKAWAEEFLILRGQLYENESGNPRFKYAPSRNRPLSRTSEIASQTVLSYLYPSGTKPEQIRERNEEVREFFAAGISKMEIGRRLGISARRVTQILEERPQVRD